MWVQQTTGWVVAIVLSGVVTMARAEPASNKTADSAGAPGSSSAPESSGAPWRDRTVTALLRVGVDIGGDAVTPGRDANGNVVSLRAGSGVALAAGVLIKPALPIAVELTAGYKTNLQFVHGDTVSLSRIPIDAIASFVLGNHRLGLGGTIHLAPSFDGFGTHIDSDTAVGGLLQWAYSYGQLDVGVRATLIGYTDPRLRHSISGNSLGGIIGLRL